MNFRERQVVSSGQFNRYLTSLDAVTRYRVGLPVGLVEYLSTDVVISPYLCSVNTFLATVHPVVDEDHVDVVGVAESYLPELCFHIPLLSFTERMRYRPGIVVRLFWEILRRKY